MKSKSLFEEAVEELGYKASGSLRSTSDADLQPNFEDLSSISEWLALGKAKRLEAHYVYFRRFDDRPSNQLFISTTLRKGYPMMLNLEKYSGTSGRAGKFHVLSFSPRIPSG